METAWVRIQLNDDGTFSLTLGGKGRTRTATARSLKESLSVAKAHLETRDFREIAPSAGGRMKEGE